MVEATKENILNLFESTYEEIVKAYDNKEDVEKLKYNIELMKRDASNNNLKICLDEIQKINDNLYKQYGDDDLVIELQVRINECRSLFDLVDESELLENGFVQ